MNVTARRTPLWERHRQAGGRMVDFAGWEMPVHYGSVVEEHRAVRTAVGLFDVSHMGEMTVRGAGAEAFLQWLTPNDVRRLTPGRAHYSGLLTERGTYVDDLLVYRLGGDSFLLVVNAANQEVDVAWVRRHAPDDVEVVDVSTGQALIAVQGPRAAAVVAPLTEVDLDALRYYHFAQGQVDGHAALVSRTGYTGEDGFELYLDPEIAPAVWDALLAAGEAFGIRPAGLGARDTLRLEAAMALYGHEIDRDTTPFEVGLDWVVKLEKGDFLGRQALVAQRERGITRRLVGLEVTGRGIAREGHTVLRDGGEVGRVTSGTWSPTLEKAIALAHLAVEHAEVGTEVVVDVRGRLVPARIVGLPFYRRPR